MIFFQVVPRLDGAPIRAIVNIDTGTFHTKRSMIRFPFFEETKTSITSSQENTSLERASLTSCYYIIIESQFFLSIMPAFFYLFRLMTIMAVAERIKHDPAIIVATVNGCTHF